MKAKIVPLADLVGDLKIAPLGNVTSIDTGNDGTISQHPPQNVTAGEAWTLGILQLPEPRPDWNSTVVFLTWDEDGGFYDHVPPPRSMPTATGSVCRCSSSPRTRVTGGWTTMCSTAPRS